MLLVPILFSMRWILHPVIIIAAVLVFGGLWGVWGVFFAIPLASLVKAVINAWPKTEVETLHGLDASWCRLAERFPSLSLWAYLL